jgi:DNA-directed RNA polymerase specialized sigma24 family protein
LDLPISTEDLTRLYRFALLLTGDEVSAQQVFYDACVDCAARLGGYRNEDGQVACLLGTLRQKAKLAPPAGGEGRGLGSAVGVARAFSTLPEEERAALAGLYTGLLPARALAEALKMSLEQMGRVLKSARERLARAGLELGEPSLEQAL